MNKQMIFKSVSNELYNLFITHNLSGNSLSILRDSIVNHPLSKNLNEEEAYENFIQHLNARHVHLDKVRFYWSGKNDDHLFLDIVEGN